MHRSTAKLLRHSNINRSFQPLSSFSHPSALISPPCGANHTLRFFSANAQKFSQQQQQQQQEQKANNRKKKSRNAKLAGAGLGFLITAYVVKDIYDQHQQNPYRSMVDQMIRKVKGSPYRDYIDIHPTSELKEGPTYVHDDPEISFSFSIPNKFIRPGVVVRDQIDMRGVGGMMESFDEFGNYVSCDWVKLPEFERHKAEDGRGDVLRDQVAKMNSNEEKAGYRVLDQRRIKSPNKGIPDLFYVMMENENTYHNSEDQFKKQLPTTQLKPLNSDILGRVVFLHPNKKHVFVVTTRYPNNMLNYDILRSEMLRAGMSAEEVEKKLSPQPESSENVIEDDNTRLFKDMCLHASSDRKKIGDMLANELLSIYLTSFAQKPTETQQSVNTTTN